MSNERRQEPSEGVDLPLDDLEKLVSEDIERGRARIANAVTILLMSGVLSTPVLFIVGLWIVPSLAAEIKAFFAGWLTALGPIVGTAVGFYFGVHRSQNTSSRLARRRQR